MKKFLSCLSLCCLVLLSGCSSQEAFQEVEIDAKELQEKLDDKEDFVVIVEREGCSYCEALDAYIEETKQEHARPGAL